MTKLLRRGRDERGQALVMTVLSLTVLVGMMALVLDVGAWFRADRRLQAVADAAVLAGAQELPHDPGRASAVAAEYAAKNAGPAVESMSIESDTVANDTISATYTESLPGVFTKVFGIDSAEVRATASARAAAPTAAKWVAPIVVNEQHPLLGCTAPGVCSPSFDQLATLEMMNLHKPGGGDGAGAFGLINLIQGNSGTVGASELAEWIETGHDEFMELGTYHSAPGADFNSTHVQNALGEKIRTGDEILLPIYRPPLKQSGSNAEFEIVGWVGFVVENVTGGGSGQKIHGHFTQVVWEGLASTSSSTPNYGVTVISLTK